MQGAESLHGVWSNKNQSRDQGEFNRGCFIWSSSWIGMDSKCKIIFFSSKFYYRKFSFHYSKNTN
jgi:hypothetical protein